MQQKHIPQVQQEFENKQNSTNIDQKPHQPFSVLFYDETITK